MTNKILDSCDCLNEITRRHFLKATVTGVTALAATGSLPARGEPLAKNTRTPSSSPETLVATLYKSLTDEQRKSVVFPFEHPLRSKVDNNWQITDKKIDQFYTPDQ